MYLLPVFSGEFINYINVEKSMSINQGSCFRQFHKISYRLHKITNNFSKHSWNFILIYILIENSEIFAHPKPQSWCKYFEEISFTWLEKRSLKCCAVLMCMP